MNRSTREDTLIEQFGYRVRQRLNLGADQIAPRTLQRLSATRSVALAKYRGVDGLVSLAPASSRGTLTLDPTPARTGWALAASALIVAAGIFFINDWHNRQAIAEIAELDTAILSDDLPVDAHADPGFLSFLKRGE